MIVRLLIRYKVIDYMGKAHYQWSNFLMYASCNDHSSVADVLTNADASTDTIDLGNNPALNSPAGKARIHRSPTVLNRESKDQWQKLRLTIE